MHTAHPKLSPEDKTGGPVLAHSGPTRPIVCTKSPPPTSPPYPPTPYSSPYSPPYPPPTPPPYLPPPYPPTSPAYAPPPPPRQAGPTPPTTRPGLLPGPEVQPVRGNCTTATLSAPPRCLVTWHRDKIQDGSCRTDRPPTQPGNGRVFTKKPVDRETPVVPLPPTVLPRGSATP